ncbi:MAG TPA: hypothetical protein VGX91_12620 [Candidatus Cybelea sp.]|nr:hypothetical protein [Candidatus Cybelea sp.]
MRRLSLGFILLSGGALSAAACGRQVTPNPPGLGPGGAPPGYMVVYFDTAGAMNFSNFEYMFVFNTSGSGKTPSTDTQQTNWAGYSYAMVALGRNGIAYAEPVQFVASRNPKAPPGWSPLGSAPNQFYFNANSNGSGSEFSIRFQQAILQGITSPSPSASPLAQSWLFNAFVTQPGASGGQWQFADSMGAGGPFDPQYVSPALCSTEPFDTTFYSQNNLTTNPSADIVSVEIANNPVSPKPCP